MLRIKRYKTFVDMVREYKVFIDGKHVGNIKNGETEAFEIYEGHHLVHLEIDWCRSKKISLDIQKNQSVNLHVGSSMRWFNFPFLYLFYLSIFRTRYIKIKNESLIIQTIENKFSPSKESDLRQLQTITF